MSKDNDDDDKGLDEDGTELACVSSRLQKPEPGPSQPAADVPHSRPLTKEDFQVLLGVERFRCPEILFHPNLVGIDQAGLYEKAGVSIRRLPSKDQVLEERLTSSILLTGGSCLYPGLSERLEAVYDLALWITYKGGQSIGSCS
ncbi:PREDICTED: actin-related protein 5-like [Populus euphratica]|uniref:Actin-related protein 5-like n=1 Tax=Populus euphratica TaxID=75702 RepID=A0AAJ6UM91_POPEU|nr:PREDICTED: actin-related protein 5-like [Populus euphratica]